MSCDCVALGQGEVFIGKDLEGGLKSLPDGSWEIFREASGYGFGGQWSIVRDRGMFRLVEANCLFEDEEGSQLHENSGIYAIIQLEDMLERISSPEPEPPETVKDTPIARAKAEAEARARAQAIAHYQKQRRMIK